MLRVIKRSGREESFDVEKIKHTLLVASDELGEPLNRSDVDRIVAPVVTFTQGKSVLTTRDIYDALIRSMEELRFTKLADAYRTNKGNYWVDSSVGV